MLDKQIIRTLEHSESESNAESGDTKESKRDNQISKHMAKAPEGDQVEENGTERSAPL